MGPIKRKISIFAGMILGVVLLAGIWGLGIEPRLILDKTERKASISNLPQSWEYRKVALLSDFQVGLWLDNDGMVERAVNAVVASDADLVLLTGDFIYHSPENPEKEIEHTVDMLRPLTENGMPVYAVLGNHDYAMGRKKDAPDFKRAEKIRTALESIGITVLQNDAVILAISEKNESGDESKKEKPLYLVGIGARWPGQDNVDLALSKVPDDMPRLVMMHHPDSFEQFPAHSAQFAVAGHTHGGQIAIPFTPQWSWMTYYREDNVHADGWIENYGEPGNNLYVNRGIGCSIAPIRINAPPELTLFTLKRSG